jgi:hypothetical protein
VSAPGTRDRLAEGIRSARLRGLFVGAVVFLLVLLRQPYTIFRPQFIWEETQAFWTPTFRLDPLTDLLQPTQGYLVIVSRAAFLVARLGPPEMAPAVTIMIHAAIIALVARFLASDRLAAAIPDGRVRTLFALSIALVPIFEVYQSVEWLQWFLAIYLAALSLTKEVRRFDYLGVTLAGLSGIGAVLTLPLFWRDRRGFVLLACGGLQALVLSRSDRLPVDVNLLAPLARVGLGIIPILLAITLVRILPLRTVLTFVYVAAATAWAGTLAGSYPIENPALGGRYFLATAAVVTLLAIAGAVARRRTGAVLCGLLIGAGLFSFWIPEPTDVHWADHAHCIGGPVACMVPAYPPELFEAWPGR